ncbi:hypothetical protein ACP4OV_017127 [Aristida adscensionis]
MAPPATGTKKGPNARHYILAALTATLAVAILVTAFFIALSPARVRFSVTDAGSHPSGDGGMLLLTLTLAANNTGRRAAVRYQSLFVDVSNSTGPHWSNWVRAAVAAAMPLRQPRASVAAVNATVALVEGPWADAFTGNMTGGSFAVMVTAVARFTVGAARTRLYDIKVVCGPVSFFPAAAKRSGVAGAGLPVECA